MTINWRYTVEENLGILSVAGYLGPDAVHRFTGAVGWALSRGTGPVIVDLTELRSWSAEGQVAIAEAARRLTKAGRSLELAAGPADGSLVPTGDGPPIPVHPDLAAALAAHGAGIGAHAEGRHEWRTTGWPDEDPAGE
ncbi:STAS domain-containing protein [Streptomyces caniscabiei]|uniref:STAS domain-containing protein n=1 Tax=Streptomyces caniscabiei TaxID=2746961 RepID=A0A927QL29_9ACTN|nr:STAS domain-containing protein [Streptomyces caniscabiei]MBD9729885.1 STAS domain-containing protein [Streptomyces caniscabiei]MDX3515594.1 STAS domain-containing protein [Streptomyces caniscabiei]MDX3724850.1 STAS domain-containing protein [Streptomyces caniscabiei]MDX3733509.1 STAS domain-containing protein [Streptomyces caniscabiei]WEO21758.1 STAS domain-containing protein [Streptomyces caniscabiei]